MLCSLLAAACPGAEIDDIDANDEGGLSFVFVTDPDIGDDVVGPYEIAVDTVSLKLRDFRAIGDAAPGDARTTAASLDLDWALDAPPDTLLFPDAPLGVYSRLEATVDRYTITGTVTANGVPLVPFEIDDDVTWSVTLALTEVALEPGTVLELKVVFRVADVVSAVDWDLVTPNGGQLRVRDGDPQIDAVRLAVADAFDVEG